MKIDLASIDISDGGYMVHQHSIGGEQVFLVQPQFIGTKWTKDTMHFRSSVWDSDGNLISASFPKFFNLGEHPELTPVPTSLKNTSLLQKIDGSTLIFSRWKGNTIVRTRGTVDASKQENGYELEYILSKYPKVKELLESADTLDYSILFEWTTPTNVIVLNYGEEPDIILIGMVFHDTYRLASQSLLDSKAVELGVKRPHRYEFDSMEQMQEAVSQFKGVEGLCLYYNDGQNILKCKGDWYLAAHRFKSEISSIDRVIDLWFETGKLKYQQFMDFITNTYDFELAVQCRGNVSRICEGWEEVLLIEEAMKAKVATLRGMTRKDQAGVILQAYGNTNRASFAFQIIDGKQWSDEAYKKLLYQVLKK